MTAGEKIQRLESEMQGVTEEPREKYEFCFSASDIEKIFKVTGSDIRKKVIAFVICMISLFFLCAVNHASDAIILIIIGLFLVGILLHISGYIVRKKAWKNNENRILESRYLYEVFDTYLTVKVFNNGEKKDFKINFSDIKKWQNLDEYHLFEFERQIFFIKKELLCKESLIHTLSQGKSGQQAIKVTEKQLHGFWRAISIVLFVCSIITLFGAMVAEKLLSDVNKFHGSENMWVFFLFVPIPVTSIIFGIFLKKKGYQYRKNIVVGVVMTVFLCMIGSLSTQYSYSDEPILRVEQCVGIDIPAHTSISTRDWSRGTQNVPRGYIYSSSDVYFEDEAVNDFEEQIKNDKRWLSEVSTDLAGITSPFFDMLSFDYMVIYNVDTKDVNKLPTEGGTYRFINVFYNSQSNQMTLVEYDMEYIK